MFSWITKIIKWILSIWNKIPEPVKKAIIEAVLKALEILFRDYYKESKKRKEEEEKKKKKEEEEKKKRKDNSQDDNKGENEK